MTELAPPRDLADLPARRPPGEGGRLGGRVVVVTGAGGGIGRAVAERFAAEGASLLLTDIAADRVQETSELVAARHPATSIVTAPLDVTEQPQWSRALRRGRRLSGAADVLVHCAGVPGHARLDSLNREEWDRLVQVNQTSVLLGLQALLPSMWAAGGGSVVLVGSVFGTVASGGAFAYHATKGATQAMVTAAAVELAPRRIRVNAVLPGLLETDLTAHLDREYLDLYLGATPLARLASPGDVADAALYLASDEASFVTGALLPVDGGYLCR